MTNPLEMTVRFHDPTLDDSVDLERSTNQLREQIHRMDVESVVRLRTKHNEPGSLSPDAFTLGALVIVVLPAVLPGLIEFFREWKLRGKDRTIIIEVGQGDSQIKVEFPEDMRPETLDLWIARVKQQIPTQSNND